MQFKVCPNIYLLLIINIYLFILLHWAIVSLGVWIVIRACRIRLNLRPLGTVHPLGLVIKQEYLARACSNTNYQAVSHMCPPPTPPTHTSTHMNMHPTHPSTSRYSLKKWVASSELCTPGWDGGTADRQDWCHLDMINTETGLNLSNSTGPRCKLQQASVHLH